MTISEAKAFFISMGCSAFHMCREEPRKYEQYKALGISASLEEQWMAESFLDTYDKVLSGQYAASLWCWHSACAALMSMLQSKDGYRKMLELTRFVASNEVDGNRVVVAETINGRRDTKFRDGLIYGAYDCGMVEEASAFAEIARWLAEHDREPVPNKNSWSIERVDEVRRKTDFIRRALNLGV